jgi:hypothetical protein
MYLEALVNPQPRPTKEDWSEPHHSILLDKWTVGQRELKFLWSIWVQRILQVLPDLLTFQPNSGSRCFFVWWSD